MNKKIVLKKFISNLVYALNILRRASRKQAGIRVMTYHSITDSLLIDDEYQMTTPRQLFEEQMQFLHDNNYNVIGCAEAVEMLAGKEPIPDKAICITFDDGFKDNLINALPVIEKFGFKATVFLTVDFIGKDSMYLNWEDILTMSEGGSFSFGGHTLSHAKLYGMNDEGLGKELITSKIIIEDHLGKKVDLFAYPFGAYRSFDMNTINKLKECGYKAAFTTIAGFNQPGADLYTLRRTRISWFDDKREFARELIGAYDWYELWQKISKTP